MTYRQAIGVALIHLGLSKERTRQVLLCADKQRPQARALLRRQIPHGLEERTIEQLLNAAPALLMQAVLEDQRQLQLN